MSNTKAEKNFEERERVLLHFKDNTIMEISISKYDAARGFVIISRYLRMSWDSGPGIETMNEAFKQRFKFTGETVKVFKEVE